MKLTILAVLLTALISNQTFSQSQNLNDYPFITNYNPGYVIKANGDSIPGNLYFGTLPEIVTFYPASDPKSSVALRTKDIKKLVSNDIVFKPLTYKQSTGLTIGVVEKFVQIFAEGKYKLFRYYTISKNLSTGENSLSVEDLIMNDKQETVNLNDFKFFNFSKGMSNYLAEYPELAEKVKNKEPGYKKSDLVKIISEFNQKFK